MIKQTYRGFKFLKKVDSLDDFKLKFGISEKAMKEAGAWGGDYDVNVIRKILRKVGKGHYLVRYVDTGNQYTDYFLIYSKFDKR